MDLKEEGGITMDEDGEEDEDEEAEDQELRAAQDQGQDIEMVSGGGGRSLHSLYSLSVV